MHNLRALAAGAEMPHSGVELHESHVLMYDRKSNAKVKTNVSWSESAELEKLLSAGRDHYPTHDEENPL